MVNFNSNLSKIAIIVVISLVILGLIFLSVENQLNSLKGLQQGNTSATTGKLGLSLIGIKSAGFTYNNSRSYVGYAYFYYGIYNASSANFSFNMYSKNPISRVYLLNVGDYCYRCLNEAGIYQNLTQYMYYYGLMYNQSSLSYINYSQLGSVVNGSIVIIPSGLIPIVLLPGASQSTTILTLLDRGDTVIYIGDNFTNSVGPGGVVYTNYTKTLNDFGLYGINASQEYFPNSTNYLGLHFSKPLFNFTNGHTFSRLNYVRSHNGTIIAFPNFENNVYNNTGQIASDIARVLFSRFWIPSYAYYNVNKTVSPVYAGRTSMLTLNTSFNTSSLNFSQEVNSAYPFLTTLAHNSTSSIGKSLSFQIRCDDNGTLGIPNRIADGQNFTLMMTVNTASSREIEPVITFYNLNYTNIFNFGLGHFNISVGLNSFDKGIDQPLPPGYYLITLSNLNGSYISGAAMDISNISITENYSDFSSGKFNFDVSSAGRKINNVGYSIKINNAFQQNGTINQGVIRYVLPQGTVVPYGNETFTITMFGTNYYYHQYYNEIISSIPPIYVEFAIAIILVVIINLLAKTPDRDEFYIDVQDFRHIDKIRIEIDKEELLGIFEKVNFYYRWKYMPLTVDEIKSGISENVKQNNMPIAITSRNTMAIMDKLKASGDIFEIGDYYVPRIWTEQSGHDATYLTIFRRLRDYCVSNGMPFTDLDKTDVADMIITRSGVQAYVTICSENKDFKGLKISKTYRNFLVFLSEDNRISFLEKLYNSYGKDVEIIKMSIYYEYVKLIDTDNLGALIF